MKLYLSTIGIAMLVISAVNILHVLLDTHNIGVEFSDGPAEIEKLFIG